MSLAAQPPLPPPPILTPPIGWLGFLGLKSGGTQPGLTAGFLQPTMEMFKFYLAGIRLPLTPATVFVAANAASAPSLIATVPQGKAWLIEQAQALGLMGAVAGQGAARITVAQANNFLYYVGPPSNEPGAAITGQSIYARSDQLIIAGPGDKISVVWSAVAGFTAFNWAASVVGVEVPA